MTGKSEDKLTPMVRQYNRIKAQYPEVLLNASVKSRFREKWVLRTLNLQTRKLRIRTFYRRVILMFRTNSGREESQPSPPRCGTVTNCINRRDSGHD